MSEQEDSDWRHVQVVAIVEPRRDGYILDLPSDDRACRIVAISV